MFDWNDEELANIIWDEAAEGDDHIVPYPEGSEEKPPGLYKDYIKTEVHQDAANVKPAEQKKSISKTDSHGCKLEINSQYDANGLPSTGFGMESWPDLSLSNAAKTDEDSMGTEISNNLTDVTKYDSSRDEAAQVDDGSEIYQNRHEDREQGDFIDYGWANIGSFDDLDRIFSNDDPIFGHVSLGNADELWSSSKDETSNQEKSFPLSVDSPNLGLEALRSTSEHFEIKTEYGLDPDQSFNPGYEKMDDLTSHPLQNVQASVDQYAGSKSKILEKKTDLEMVGSIPAFNHDARTPSEVVDKVNMQKKLLKSQKNTEERSEMRHLQDFCNTWSPSGNQIPQFDGQYSPHLGQSCPSPAQQRQLQGAGSPCYVHFSNPLLAPSMYGNVVNQFPVPAMPALPRFHSGEDNHQLVLPGREVSPVNANLLKSPDTAVKPLTMTPREKIEKLRRRQQMRAMLAIKKQHQQFTHQVSCTNQFHTKKCSVEGQLQFMEAGNIEVEDNPSALHSLDPNSPLENDDSNTISMAIDNCSVEDTILHQLQDVIAKLDIRIRFCIRDSLFRLAQSAMQRHYASDTGSTNKSSKDDVLAKEINSHGRMPDMETQTNPIDRTVAHLLFHRPLESSGKHPETLDSPVSTKFPCERKATGLMNLPMGFLRENSENKQQLPHQGSTPGLLAEGDQSKNSPCIDSSENASYSEPADGVPAEVEASH